MPWVYYIFETFCNSEHNSLSNDFSHCQKRKKPRPFTVWLSPCILVLLVLTGILCNFGGLQC